MKDTFEFTLKENPSEELFEMLSDVNVETTPSFTVQDTHGNIAEYVKVIRCNDCKYAKPIDSEWLECQHDKRVMKATGFCSWAERIEE